MVAWHATEDKDEWAYDPDLSRASEFEVTFREQPDSGPGGWPGIVDNYAKVATAA